MSIRLVTLSVAMTMLPACASIVDGTLESAETITFISVPSGATIKSGTRTICITPCQQRVATYQIRSLYAELEGYPTIELSSAQSFNPNMLGNIIAGGVVGAGLDALTGRAFSYDDVIDVRFELNEGGSAVVGPVDDAVDT